ncbi:MAG: hypothetical protein HC830_13325 [Bacteroidetes bacterium]|nr:hypothetical protein [Bacteroidota bacterium]
MNKFKLTQIMLNISELAFWPPSAGLTRRQTNISNALNTRFKEIKCLTRELTLKVWTSDKNLKLKRRSSLGTKFLLKDKRPESLPAFLSINNIRY